MKGGMCTATTRLITHHISKGESVAQSLKDRFDYGQNPEKTGGGELISSYACDHQTADAEFLLSKAKYKAATGREQRRDADVLCYQIRQSFRPGEITPEEANRVGYETAMRWTKGNHAFFVATHTDRQHIHNHIYYNSVSLDCSRKLRDFWRSARALRRLSDRVCLENDLSVIERPKLHSKGRFLHYGQWVGERPPSAKQRVRLAVIDALAQKPGDWWRPVPRTARQSSPCGTSLPPGTRWSSLRRDRRSRPGSAHPRWARALTQRTSAQSLPGSGLPRSCRRRPRRPDVWACSLTYRSRSKTARAPAMRVGPPSTTSSSGPPPSSIYRSMG